MTKQDFLQELESKLKPLPEKEAKEQLNYYEELLSDMIEDGIDEDEAVAKLGDIDKITEEIFLELPLPAIVKSKFQFSKTATVLTIIIAIIGSPIWIPICMTLLGSVLSVALFMISLIITVIRLIVSFISSAIFMIIQGITLFPIGIGYSLFAIGVGFVMLGISCLLILFIKSSFIELFHGIQYLYRKAKLSLIKRRKKA